MPSQPPTQDPDIDDDDDRADEQGEGDDGDHGHSDERGDSDDNDDGAVGRTDARGDSEAEPDSEGSDDEAAAEDDAEAPVSERASPRAPEVAPFLRGLPDHPELNALVLAFTKGDYRAVREGAPRLARAAESEEVAQAANDLLRRIKPDPLLRYLFLVSIALLVVLSIFAYGQGH